MKQMLHSRASRAVAGAILAAGVSGGLGVAWTGSAAAADNSADTWVAPVVHGIASPTADSYRDGKIALTGLRLGGAGGLLPLSAGAFKVATHAAGDHAGAVRTTGHETSLPAGPTKPQDTVQTVPQSVNGSGELTISGSSNVPVVGALTLGGLMLISTGGLITIRVRR